MPKANTAIDHLGNVLALLENLSPMLRCRSFDAALDFYNAARPDCQVRPIPGYVTMLVTVGPLDWLPTEDPCPR